MKRFRVFIILSILMSGLSVIYSQTVRTDNASVIQDLFTRLVKARNDEDKIRINDSIIILIDSYSRTDTVFNHNLEGIKYLGQITARKSKLKILTWNLLLQDSKSSYYSYFIYRPEKTNIVYPLTAVYKENPLRTDTIYTDENWYGALYYDLRPYSKDNQQYWVLLGIDYGNPAVTRKVIDVLSFSGDSNMVFGKKIFYSGDEVKYREVLEYSAEAVASLKFESDKTIVFDHLVPLSPVLKGRKEFYGPDFSLDAYSLEKGIWKLKENIDIRNER